jgi:quercetin dioxygenase-like cupin family protein
MKSRWIWLALVPVLGVGVVVGRVLATPATGGFQGTTAAMALGVTELAIHAKSNPPDTWQTILNTKGLTDIYVQHNVWPANSSTGWHTHPGPSLVIIKQGTVRVYEGNDPTCTPHEYSANGNNSFVDVGGGVVHNVRNETGDQVEGYAVQFVPAGATRRIDEPNPGNCPF